MNHMQMLRELPPIEQPQDKNGKVLYKLPIDQYPAQEFNRNKGGWTANDLTLLERSQTLAETELILSRLQQERAKNPDNTGKSDRDIILETRPAWCQTPSEIDRFVRLASTRIQEKIESRLGKPNETTPPLSSEALGSSSSSSSAE